VPKIEIDAAAIARLTGFGVGTVNVWVSRGIIPGTTAAGQGRMRLFDETQARHIAIVANLVHLGYAAPFASTAACSARDGADQPGARLIVGPPRKQPSGLRSGPSVDFFIAKSPDELDRRLAKFVDGPPECYTVVKVDQIAERVRKFVNDPDLMEKAERGISRKWAKAHRALTEPRLANKPAITEPTEP
jgi:hypothetical protein